MQSLRNLNSEKILQMKSQNSQLYLETLTTNDRHCLCQAKEQSRLQMATNKDLSALFALVAVIDRGNESMSLMGLSEPINFLTRIFKIKYF